MSQKGSLACTSNATTALPLRVGVSLRALFDLELEHAVFDEHGIDAYVKKQHDLENAPIAKGPGFEAIARLLALNVVGRPALVEVIVVSRNAPEVSLRAFAAMRDYGLSIITGSFTNGGAIAPILKAWNVDLFLSKEATDVEAAHAIGIAAATLGSCPTSASGGKDGEIRIAVDGDAVVFSDESDRVFARHGLEAFLRHETEQALAPMKEGPFAGFVRKLAALREVCRNAGHPHRIRLALVTARTAPAHSRVIHTLRAWGLEVDEAHFVGRNEKAPLLAAFGAHIYFDDQEHHIALASDVVAAAHVPGSGCFVERR